MLISTRLALATLFILALTPLAAQNFDNGLAAYDAGDYTTAIQEWTPLAEAGNSTMQFFLGDMYMYELGEGVPQNYAEAAKWYRLAAEQGYADAQNNLGVKYNKGEGVPQDYVMSHMWYNIASANGHENAGEYRDRLTGLMTTADISKAQAMARECMSSGYTKCGY